MWDKLGIKSDAQIINWMREAEYIKNLIRFYMGSVYTSAALISYSTVIGNIVISLLL
jgi:hypothetical protein